ncbi:stage II sporulation protein M [Candidatus Woesearchaeota archaeon]|nr:MAG: stage II sporulation protein M [Candidatus Woesearchaeota archaeon]
MVFEQLYSAKYLHDHPWYGFLLGMGYTILALFIALMIWPSDPSLVAVGIISLFCMPSLFKLTDSAEITNRKLPSFKSFLLETIPHAKVYVAIFFGVFFTFAIFAILLPKLAVSHLFKIQLDIVAGQASSGGATFSTALFWDLFTWNLNVLGLSFFLSLVAGNGGIVFIVWNASVWGTIFGNLAKTAALVSTANPFIVFTLIILSVFPHTFLEGLSYMLSAISGSTLSDGIVKEKLISKKMWNVTKYNLCLLGIAILVLAIGMIVETYVLNNFTTYRKIIMIAFPR